MTDLKSIFMANNSPQLVLFDWDGTLVNSSDYVPDIHAQILAELGIPLGKDVIAGKIGISQTDLLSMALAANNQDTDDQRIKALVPKFVALEDKIFDDYYADRRIDLLNGAREFIEHLAARNINMGIVSNAFDVVTIKRVKDTRLTAHFNPHNIFGRTRAGTTKPDPTQIRMALGHYNCAVSEAIFFGDSQSDRDACERSGIRMVQVGRLDLEPYAIHVINDFTTLGIN